MASLLTCLILAVVHGAGLIQRYRTYPTRVQLDVSNRQGIPLPAVTVCPLNRFHVKRLQLLWRQTMTGSNDSNSRTIRLPKPVEQYYQLAGVLPIDQLWTRISYPDVKSLFLMVIPSKIIPASYRIIYHNLINLFTQSVTSAAGPNARMPDNSSLFGRHPALVLLIPVISSPPDDRQF